MGPSSRGLYILESEISVVLMAMKRGNLWNSNTHQDTNTENLIKEFVTLKKSLGSVQSFFALDTVEFLMPFLNVIRSEDVTGHVTGLALSSVHKFLSYDLLDEAKPGVRVAVENLADAVTHARFVGSDPSSDEVVLMKILDVLRILILSKVGLMLTNESICEIMQSTLRICFEPRLSELLRQAAQHCLNDMVQLLFTRLPLFTQNQKPLLKKLKMRSALETKGKRKSRSRIKRSTSPNLKPKTDPVPTTPVTPTCPTGVEPPPQILPPSSAPCTETPLDLASPAGGQMVKFSVGGEMLARSPVGSVQDLSVVSDVETEERREEMVEEEKGESFGTSESEVEIQVTSPEGTVRHDEKEKETNHITTEFAVDEAEYKEPERAVEFTNEVGVTFANTLDSVDSDGTLVPYGLPAVYELLRFLASLVNPHEASNSEQQIVIGLSLITCALEVGVASLAQFPSLLALAQDNISRHLISLLSSERVGVFSSALRCCFLMFDALRPHLKLQLETFLVKLADIVSSESVRVSYEQKELGLELLVQLYKMPGFITELYLNYDCGLYTSNLFEDLTKVLSKNSFPVSGILSTHHLALEGLTVVLDSIERNCQKRISDRIPQPPPFSSPTKTQEKTGPVHVPSASIMTKSSGHLFGKSEDIATCEFLESDKPVPPTAVPTHENLMAIKHKKKLISTGTDHFNVKPSKGVEYLQEARLLSRPMDPYEVARWLRENPHLDKNMIGEFISNRKNLDVLKAFVKSFDFIGLRIDESLRSFLTTFRLPGEAPLISTIMEIFSEHWHMSAKQAGQGLADEDSPFTLSYAVIMLNTDQHNPNASKTNVPMTQQQFINNLRNTNGGGDHDPEMLAEVYQAIRNEEIVMPAEQTGLVKENYEWKLLLKRSQEEMDFLIMDNGMFDHNLFGLTWGPAIAALSYVFDKSGDPEVMRRALDGFSKCAMIAAHYAMTDVLDNLVATLTKFTTLLSTTETAENFKVMFGANKKSLLATRAVFSLTHKYGDILREGWRGVVECLLQLFQCELLPRDMMEAEDFIEPGGRVKLFRECLPREKEDSGLINSLVSFIVASSEVPRELSREEEELVEVARVTVAECHPEHLLQESKFLLTESLQELVKFLIAGSVLDPGSPAGEKVVDSVQHACMFYLELVTRITLANRDRVGAIWRGVVDHLHRMISAFSRTLGGETQFQLERAVTSLLRLGVRLARKEELATTVVQSLRILLAIKPGSIFHVCKQVSYGLHDLLRNNAANIHTREDWSVVFSLLEVVGAGANPDLTCQERSDEDSGQGGTEEEDQRERAGSGGWIDLGRRTGKRPEVYSIVHTRQIVMHDSVAFLKCCESLSFLVRDVVHVTPDNFSLCVAAIRTFVEASYRGDSGAGRELGGGKKNWTRSSGKRTPRGGSRASGRRVRTEPKHGGYEADESSDEELVGEYTHVTMQLLDLMFTLHTRALGVHEAWERSTEELWDTAWCPVLQGMARLCCDSRNQVRTQALTLLQRSLLVQDLLMLAPNQWEFAFLRVLFPMLRRLLEQQGGQGREETKLRAAMMLSKVFLQHLGPLSALPTFTALWLTILDLVGQFCASASTDILADALPESLKNMLLVMDTSGRPGLFFYPETGAPTPLWEVTWEKIDTFLPGLKGELFPDWQIRARLVQRKEEVTGASTKPAEEETGESTKTVEGEEEETGEGTEPSGIPTSDNKTVVTQNSEDAEVATGEVGTIPNEASSAPCMEVNEEVADSPLHYPPVIHSLSTEAPPTNYSPPVRVRNPSLPGPSPVYSNPPLSPVEPPTMPYTAFSLPTSPSHAPATFTPITPAPSLLPSMTPLIPLATPRPVLATTQIPIPGPPTLPSLISPSSPTAFTNPLLTTPLPSFSHFLPSLAQVSSPEQNPAPTPVESQTNSTIETV